MHVYLGFHGPRVQEELQRSELARFSLAAFCSRSDSARSGLQMNAVFVSRPGMQLCHARERAACGSD